MAFRLSSFLGGAAKGATDLIEEREKENALQIKESIKNMYHNYAEYRKETDKKKEHHFTESIRVVDWKEAAIV